MHHLFIVNFVTWSGRDTNLRYNDNASSRTCTFSESQHANLLDRPRFFGRYGLGKQPTEKVEETAAKLTENEGEDVEDFILGLLKTVWDRQDICHTHPTLRENISAIVVVIGASITVLSIVQLTFL